MRTYTEYKNKIGDELNFNMLFKNGNVLLTGV